MKVNSFTLASIWHRVFAIFIDFIFFSIIFFPATKLVKGVWIMSASDHRWAYGLFITDPLCIIFLIFIILYFILLEGCWGKTLGKWVLKIKIIKEDGGLPGIKASAIRNLLRIVDSLPALNILGIILIITSQKNKRFGDIIANTIVLKGR